MNKEHKHEWVRGVVPRTLVCHGCETSIDESQHPESWPEVRKRLEKEEQRAGDEDVAILEPEDVRVALTHIDELEKALEGLLEPGPANWIPAEAEARRLLEESNG